MQDQSNSSSVKNYDTSTLTDEELAKKAQEELNMEEDIEEVSSVFKWVHLLIRLNFFKCSRLWRLLLFTYIKILGQSQSLCRSLFGTFN